MRIGVLLLTLLLSMGGCGLDRNVPATPDVSGGSTQPAGPEQPVEPETEEGQEAAGMRMVIGDTEVTVEWETNEAVEALAGLCADAPLEIPMSMYGGFEQVGPIGEELPRNDVQTTTRAGDIVLYAGNQIVVFYGSNSWSYTRLGHIAGVRVGRN